jgi:hypothetical protein
MEGKLLPIKGNFQKCTYLAETILVVVRLLDTFHLRSNRKQTGKICEDFRSHPKREIYILCKNLHRDGCVGSTPRGHKFGIQELGMDTKH